MYNEDTRSVTIAGPICRLCDGATIEKFYLTGIFGVNIRYFECRNCGCLQTQQPTWLSDAYASSNLSVADTGAAQRVLLNHAFVLAIAKIFRLKTILDFGGGDGLLCRLLRDRGLDAYVFDNYAKPVYASSFRGTLDHRYDLITAFEVLEHLVSPSATLEQLFQSRPRLIIASTEIYCGQDASWWYLCPSHGQHIFFYSRKALQLLASKYRYAYYDINGHQFFFAEPVSRIQLRTILRLTAGRVFKLFRATLPFSETWTWAARDHELAIGATGHDSGAQGGVTEIRGSSE
jgi:hypothetical protein